MLGSLPPVPRCRLRAEPQIKGWAGGRARKWQLAAHFLKPRLETKWPPRTSGEVFKGTHPPTTKHLRSMCLQNEFCTLRLMFVDAAGDASPSPVSVFCMFSTCILDSSSGIDLFCPCTPLLLAVNGIDFGLLRGLLLGLLLKLLLVLFQVLLLWSCRPCSSSALLFVPRQPMLR